jgi:cytochrome c-type biogenesis protein CcmH/NrfG
MFWFVSGVLAGVTGTLIAIPLWRASVLTLARPSLRYVRMGGATVALFAVSAALIYLGVGSPGALNRGSAVVAPHQGVAQATGKAQSMEAATAGLEARLTREGGTPDEWQLLARSYDFLGRPDDAKRARARAADGGAKSTGRTEAPSMGPTQQDLMGTAPQDATAATRGATASAQRDQTATTQGTTPDVSASDLERRLRANPRDAQMWLALANVHRSHRDYDKARAAYLKAISLNGMTAQAWADYADTLGSLSGGTLGWDAGRAIDQALALDPTNAKALWLKASRAHQEHRYADALADWKRLRAVLPPGSPDARLVEANIVEASQLAGLPVEQSAQQAPPLNLRSALALGAATNPDSGVPDAEISGTVSIDDSLAGRVSKDSTLFIYAKAVDSPGPPLAVLRTSTASWPVSFRLGDSMAMTPTRRLSQFQKVVIEARVSRSGQAQPAAGDLYVTSDVLRPGTGRKLALVINREIG